MIKLVILRWELILDCLGGSDVITRVLIRRRQRVRIREGCEDAMLCLSKMEEGAGAKECRQPLEAGKGRKRIVS